MASRTSTEGFPVRSTSMVPQSTTMTKEVSRARDNENLPAIPHTPLDPERGQTSIGQANGTAHSPKSSINHSLAPAWNAQHPCYPHINPHVPITSPLLKSTRVIRVPRNWTVAGDLYPAYSNVYPEILAPWVSEVDFRTLIEGLNAKLAQVFDPTGARAWVDGVLGCLTGWVWEDLGFNKSKSGMKDIEKFIDKWNQEVKSKSQAEDADLVQCIQLRRTGFLNVDIVIPDPKVMVVNEAQMKHSQVVGNQPPNVA